MKGSKSSSDAKGLELTAGLAMAGAEENEVIPNGSSNPELALKVSLKFKPNVIFLTQANTYTIITIKGPSCQFVRTNPHEVEIN